MAAMGAGPGSDLFGVVGKVKILSGTCPVYTGLPPLAAMENAAMIVVLRCQSLDGEDQGWPGIGSWFGFLAVLFSEVLAGGYSKVVSIGKFGDREVSPMPLPS